MREHRYIYIHEYPRDNFAPRSLKIIARILSSLSLSPSLPLPFSLARRISVYFAYPITREINNESVNIR